jgi:hypothetical protein
VREPDHRSSESVDLGGRRLSNEELRSVGSVLLCVMHIVCEHDQTLKLIPYGTS